jgi:hypothetical protein
MSDESKEKHLKLWTPASYRIKVEGYLDERMSDRLGGLRISARRRKDLSEVTTLAGRIRDQAELAGILNNLYEMHLPILSVENLPEDDNTHGEDP